MIGSNPGGCSQFRAFACCHSVREKSGKQSQESPTAAHKRSFGYEAERGRRGGCIVWLIIARRCPLHRDFDFFLECLYQIWFHWHSGMNPGLDTHRNPHGPMETRDLCDHGFTSRLDLHLPHYRVVARSSWGKKNHFIIMTKCIKGLWGRRPYWLALGLATEYAFFARFSFLIKQKSWPEAVKRHLALTASCSGN